MLRSVVLNGVLLVMVLGSRVSGGADWMVAPSYYTHDPVTAQRVSQFSPIGPVYVYTAPNYTRSGYRNYRSTIQAGGSADNFHMVEEWGKPVAPYEQWRNPYRPYGAPYQDWGAPFAGANFGGGWGGGWGGGGWGGGAGGQPFNPYSRANSPAQWQDGYYPSYNLRDRSDYYRSYP
jgi:hypothetical protein